MSTSNSSGEGYEWRTVRPKGVSARAPVPSPQVVVVGQATETDEAHKAIISEDFGAAVEAEHVVVTNETAAEGRSEFSGVDAVLQGENGIGDLSAESLFLGETSEYWTRWFFKLTARAVITASVAAFIYLFLAALGFPFPFPS